MKLYMKYKENPLDLKMGHFTLLLFWEKLSGLTELLSQAIFLI